MEKILLNVLFFMALMFIVFFVDYYFIMRRRLKEKSKKKKEQMMEIVYLTSKFNLDKNKIHYKPVLLWCALINGFIISLVSTIIVNIKLHMMWQLLIGFVLLFALIYAIYEIYGRHLVRKGWKKKDE